MTTGASCGVIRNDASTGGNLAGREFPSFPRVNSLTLNSG